MKILVFGATGRVGGFVVQALLDDGHDVIAFVHRSSLKINHPKLKLYRGDVYNHDDVAGSMKDAEAVISTLGSWRTKDKDVVSKGIFNIVESMQKLKLKRIISLTGTDALVIGEPQTLISKVMHFIIRIGPARKILLDGEAHIALLQDSGLDWTVLRSPIMNNYGPRNGFSIVEIRPKPWSTINRQSVADAMVSLLEKKLYFKQAPFIRRLR